MTCEELLDYIDDELASATQEHLATCADCRVVLSTTRKTIVLGLAQGRRVILTERRGELFARLQTAFLKRSDA